MLLLIGERFFGEEFDHWACKRFSAFSCDALGTNYNLGSGFSFMALIIMLVPASDLALQYSS